MNQLVLVVDSAWPSDHLALPWYWLDERGRVLQTGYGPPEQWPGRRHAESIGPRASVVLLLSGRQVACHEIKLPAGKAASRQEVLAHALEDVLLVPPADVLAVPLLRQNLPGKSPVAVLDKNRLRGLVERLSGLGYHLRAAWPLGFVLPGEGERRLAWWDGDSLVLPAGAHAFANLVLDLEGQVPDFWRSQCAGQRILFASGTDCPEALAASAECQPDKGAGLLARLPHGPGFLVNEFSPLPLSSGDKVHRQLASGAAFVFLLLLVLTMGEWGYLKWRLHQLQLEVASAFHEVLPSVPMVAPVLQLGQFVEQKKSALGIPVQQDFLPLLGAIDVGLAHSWVQIAYQDGRLELAALLDDAQLDRLREDSIPGVRIQIQNEKKQPDGLTAVLLSIRARGGMR